MVKVLFYSDTPMLGGCENQMLLLAKNLTRERFSVTLACPAERRLNPWCQKFMEEGFEVQRLQVFHKHDPRHFFYLKKLLPKFDLIHIHIWNPASCRYALLAARGVPTVVTEHDPFPLTGIKGWIKEKLIPRANRIICCSQDARDKTLAQRGIAAERIRIIPNGIELDSWNRETENRERNEFREANLGSLRDRIILCVAELNKRKGQAYLILAMRKILQKFPDAKLVLVGRGPEQRAYQKLALPLRDRIVFLGQRRDIAELMAASDLFVLPSVREAFGLVLLEAAASQLPVIATTAGGIPEIINDKQTGLLVPPENAEALADGIITMLEHPREAQKFAKAALEKTIREFDAKKMAERTAAVYDEIL